MTAVGTYDLTDEKQVKAWHEELQKVWKFDCYSEKNAEACHNLGQFHAGQKLDFQTAGKIYKKTCDDYRLGKSCYHYAQLLFIGKGVPKDKKLSLEFHERGCDGDPPHAAACHNAALMRSTKHFKAFKDYTKAAALFERGCDLGDSISCSKGSGMYFVGNDEFDRDPAKGIEIGKKGCELRDWQSCVNVAIAYSKGDGVTQDKAMFDKFMKRADILYRDKNPGKPGLIRK